MNILWQAEPVAGQPFSLTVDNVLDPPCRVQLFIDNQVVRDVECADPPCHEVYNVPADAIGSVLAVVATDQTTTERREFTIRGRDTNIAYKAEKANMQ